MSRTTPIRQKGRRSLGERGAVLVMVLAFPLGVAWMLGGLLAADLVPQLKPFVAAHPAVRALFFPPIVFIPIIGVSAVINARSKKRSLAELVGARGRLCLNCRYNLAQLAPSGACPECGCAYDPGQLKRGWCRTYAELAYEIEWA